MVSFDVVSFFTNMPVDDALRSISTLLSNNDTMEERTTFTAGDICYLTELCLRATYFQFGDQFFEQVDGAAMGSPLSPIVANLYIETFEKEALASPVTTPRLWLRYVDDTFVIWTHGGDKLEELHHHLNQRHPQMKFTREIEDNRISFLDVLSREKEWNLRNCCIYTVPPGHIGEDSESMQEDWSASCL